jgi:hypothetical protein
MRGDVRDRLGLWRKRKLEAQKKGKDQAHGGRLAG